MEQSEQTRLWDEIRRFRLAASDMDQAAAAAEALAHERLNEALCRALETAIAVCYARPFGASNRIGGLGDEWKPEHPNLRELHDALLRLRDQLYAHNDRTRDRDVVDLSPMLDGRPWFAERWRSLDRSMLPFISTLAKGQQARFQAEVAKREKRLRSQPSPSA